MQTGDCPPVCHCLAAALWCRTCASARPAETRYRLPEPCADAARGQHAGAGEIRRRRNKPPRAGTAWHATTSWTPSAPQLARYRD